MVVMHRSARVTSDHSDLLLGPTEAKRHWTMIIRSFIGGMGGKLMEAIVAKWGNKMALGIAAFH